MTHDEIITDMNERVDRGVLHLAAMVDNAVTQSSAAGTGSEKRSYWGMEAMRLRGKIEGLKVAKDWLRAYREVGV